MPSNWSPSTFKRRTLDPVASSNWPKPTASRLESLTVRACRSSFIAETFVSASICCSSYQPASCISASFFFSLQRAIFFGSKPSNALRKAGRLRRMVIQLSPAWKPSSTSFSNIA